MRLAKIACLTAALAVHTQSIFAQGRVVIHHLRIASSQTANLSDQVADGIIDKMNQDIQTKGNNYGWDTGCTNVKFVRDGHVFISPNIKDSGTYDELAANLHQIAPQANVLVVTNLICNGSIAAGCSPVGGEPEIVSRDWPDYNDMIWLHERGHNMKLRHTAEAPTLETQAPDSVSKRIMFWQLGNGHYGKTSAECAAFSSMLYASETRSTMTPTVVAAAAPPPAGKYFVGQKVQSGGAQSPSSKEANAANVVGLTANAYAVVSVPWVDGAPVSQIKALTSADLDSIRKSLGKGPNQYSAQSVAVLGIAGNASDVKLLEQAAPMAAMPPGNLSASAQQNLRWLAATKASSIVALGSLATRTQSPAAIVALEKNLDLGASPKSLGAISAAQFSKTTLSVLSKTNAPAAKATVQKAIQAASSAPTNGTVSFSTNAGVKVTMPNLSKTEIKALNSAIH